MLGWGLEMPTILFFCGLQHIFLHSVCADCYLTFLTLIDLLRHSGTHLGEQKETFLFFKFLPW